MLGDLRMLKSMCEGAVPTFGIGMGVWMGFRAGLSKDLGSLARGRRVGSKVPPDKL